MSRSAVGTALAVFLRAALLGPILLTAGCGPHSFGAIPAELMMSGTTDQVSSTGFGNTQDVTTFSDTNEVSSTTTPVGLDFPGLCPFTHPQISCATPASCGAGECNTLSPFDSDGCARAMCASHSECDIEQVCYRDPVECFPTYNCFDTEFGCECEGVVDPTQGACLGPLCIEPELHPFVGLQQGPAEGSGDQLCTGNGLPALVLTLGFDPGIPCEQMPPVDLRITIQLENDFRPQGTYPIPSPENSAALAIPGRFDDAAVQGNVVIESVDLDFVVGEYTLEFNGQSFYSSFAVPICIVDMLPCI